MTAYKPKAAKIKPGIRPLLSESLCHPGTKGNVGEGDEQVTNVRGSGHNYLARRISPTFNRLIQQLPDLGSKELQSEWFLQEVGFIQKDAIAN